MGGLLGVTLGDIYKHIIKYGKVIIVIDTSVWQCETPGERLASSVWETMDSFRQQVLFELGLEA